MHRAEVNLTSNVTIDSACHFATLQEAEPYVVKTDRCHTCFLKSELDTEVTESEFENLQFIGCPVRDPDAVRVFEIASILGKHFKAGEWGQMRCGSVVTCVINGRSLYARVLKFMKVDGDSCPGYASVRWLSAPTYVNRLCPRVTLDGTLVEREVRVNVVRITQIDPSQVMVERLVGGDTGGFNMMRDSGYDTII